LTITRRKYTVAFTIVHTVLRQGPTIRWLDMVLLLREWASWQISRVLGTQGGTGYHVHLSAETYHRDGHRSLLLTTPLRICRWVLLRSRSVLTLSLLVP